MSYIVFALKWRPKNLDELVGQDRVVTTLKNAIQKNRLAHAYLFTGPKGVGKTSTARILAKALNCKDGPIAEPCGVCPACQEIAQGRSLDVIEIDGASNRGIDEIRALRENVKFAPSRGKYKVYIIDEVHQITHDGFNALLKTLEEPPEFVKFIFATTQPHRVPPTILSRCQRLDFRRISVMEITNQLEKIALVENINLNKDVLLAIAKCSDGSLRDAESILDQLTTFSQDKISLKDVISMLGVVEQDTLFLIADKIVQKDPRAVLVLFNELIDQGKDAGTFLNNLLEHFRNLMIAKISQADSRLIDLPDEICQRLLKQAQYFTLEEIFSAFNTLVNAQEMSKRLESTRIPLEISLVKLTHQKRETNAQGALLKEAYKPPPKDSDNSAKPKPGIDINVKPEKETAQKEKEEDAVDKNIEEAQNTIALESIKNVWQKTIDAIAGIKMSVATYLNVATPVKIENNILVIGLPKNHSLHKETLEHRENREIIEKIFSENLNARIRINFIFSESLINKDDTLEDPFIKNALEAFNGRVIRS